MDPLTHALTGASLAAALSAPGRRRLAALVGALGAVVVDADVLLGARDDPLLQLELHRHFTHALVFVPVAAAVVAALLWLTLRRWRPEPPAHFPWLWLYAGLGCATAGLLDACTSYGTHLLWPFSEARTAWSIIAVVDPVFSLTLLIGLAVALVRDSRAAAVLGLAAAGCYLTLGLVQHTRAEAALLALAEQRGHRSERLQVKPTLANLLVWRGVYQAEGRFWVAAIRIGADAEARVYPGGSLPRAELATLAIPAGSTQARDVARFARLSAGYLVQHPEQPAVLGDIRYALRPDGLAPLWGIELDPERAAKHVRLREFRAVDAALWRRFKAMLAGDSLAFEGPPRRPARAPQPAS